MVIDKLQAFLTEQEKARLIELDNQIGDPAIEDQAAVIAEKRTIQDPAREKYREYRKEDIPAILADALEILGAVTESDYLHFLKKISPIYKRELDNFLETGTLTDGTQAFYLRTFVNVSRESCLNFLKSCTLEQTNYLWKIGGQERADCAAALKEIKLAIETTATNICPIVEQKKADKELAKTAEEELKEKDLPAFRYAPSGPANMLFMRALTYGNDIAKLQNRTDTGKGKQHIEVLSKGDKYVLVYESDSAYLKLGIDKLDKINSYPRETKALFEFALEKVNRLPINEDGTLGVDEVSFPLQELVDCGMFKSVRSARTMFEPRIDAITSLSLSGKIYPKKKGKYARKKTEQSTKEKPEDLIIAATHPFTGGYIYKSRCIITLERRFPWTAFLLFFTILPPYYFMLSNRAGSLCYLIFTSARQNPRIIEKQGYFLISFEAIQTALNLPGEKETIHPKRDIIEQMKKAVDEIMQFQKKVCNNNDLQLELDYDKNANISNILKDGKLKASFNGEFYKQIIKQSISRNTQIEKAKERQKRIEEKAAAIKKAKAAEA